MQEFIVGVIIGMLIVGVAVAICLIVKQLSKSKINVKSILKKWQFWVITIIVIPLLITIASADRTYGYVVKTENVMNGFKTEVIGKYGYVEIKKAELTNDMLTHIYHKEVEDSNFNWFTIRFEDGTGVQFRGSTMYPIYGQLDEEDCVIEETLSIMPTFSDSDGSVNGFELQLQTGE